MNSTGALRPISRFLAAVAVVAAVASCGGSDDTVTPPTATAAKPAVEQPAPEPEIEEPVGAQPAPEEPVTDTRTWAPIESTIEPTASTISYIDYIGIYKETGSPPKSATIFWETPTLTLTRPDSTPAGEGSAWVVLTADVTMHASKESAPGSWATFIDQDGVSYPVEHERGRDGLNGWWAAQVPETITGGRFEFELGTLTYAGMLVLGDGPTYEGSPLDLTANTFEVEVAFPTGR